VILIVVRLLRLYRLVYTLLYLRLYIIIILNHYSSLYNVVIPIVLYLTLSIYNFILYLYKNGRSVAITRGGRAQENGTIH